MKVFYLATIRLPTEKAHGLQIMKTCEALARQGVDVELIVPKRTNRHHEDPFVFYGVEKNFKITTVPCWDLISSNLFGKFGFWLTSWLFYSAAKKYLRNQSGGVYYTRDEFLAYWLGKDKYPYFYEIHTVPDTIKLRHKDAWERSSGMVVISNGLRDELIRQGVPTEKILVARDAVDIKQFSKTEEKTLWRRSLQLPLDKKIIVYTGHFYAWKGASILAEAAKLVPEVAVYLVGGTHEDARLFHEKYDNVPNLHIIAWQMHNLMPVWLNAADVLVVPTSGKTKIGSLYTSPLKLFEYIMAKRPIVAADIPSIREVLSESTATFFEPDNPRSLAAALRAVLAEPGAAGAKATRAYEEAKLKYSWDTRAKNILEFLNHEAKPHPPSLP